MDGLTDGHLGFKSSFHTGTVGTIGEKLIIMNLNLCIIRPECKPFGLHNEPTECVRRLVLPNKWTDIIHKP